MMSMGSTGPMGSLEAAWSARRARRELRRVRALYAAAGLLAALTAALAAWLIADTLSLVIHAGLLPVALGFQFDPDRGKFGLLPFVWGSVVVGAVALVVAVPLALSWAVLATKRMSPAGSRLMTGGMTALVAVPSVLWGWWGLSMVVPAVRAALGGPGPGLVAAGVTVAAMVVPTIAALAAESLAAVPPALEDASRALGASEDTTLLAVTLSAARPGLMRAVLLGEARVLAETMAVAMVVGGQPVARLHIEWPGVTLTTGILTHLAALSPATAGGQAVSAMALLLLVAAAWMGRRLRQLGQGA
jgi:phosphate transport system permease protein